MSTSIYLRPLKLNFMIIFILIFTRDFLKKLYINNITALFAYETTISCSYKYLHKAVDKLKNKIKMPSIISRNIFFILDSKLMQRFHTDKKK